MTPTSTVENDAQDLAHAGWYVFPLAARSKVPKAGSAGFKDATRSADVIREWFDRDPDANLGIATGPSGLVVLDVDVDHGGWDTLTVLREQFNIDLETACARTGSGMHYYYAAPADVEIRISAGQLGDGLDIRAAGGYVVAPPSIHPNGKRYVWQSPPWETATASFPPALIRLLTPGPMPAAEVVGAVIGSSTRNTTLTSLAGSMRRRGMSEEGIRAALLVENRQRCRPPLSEHEVAVIARSVSRYEPEAAPIAVSQEPPQQVSGIYDVSDLSADIDRLYEHGFDRGLELSAWPEFSQHYRVAPGQWTLVTGVPSHGKSAFIDAMTVNLGKQHEWRFVVCSPENQPLARHCAKLIRCYLGKPFDHNNFEPRMSYKELVTGKSWLYDHYMFVSPEDDQWSVDNVLKCAEAAYERRPYQGLLLDPWNELDQRPASMSETEFINVSLTKLRRFARRMKVHIWLIAHPAKLYRQDGGTGNYPVPRPYDVSGSAHWFNKADNALTVYRDDQDRGVEIHIQKIRFDTNGQRGMVTMRYQVSNGQYVEVAAA